LKNARVRVITRGGFDGYVGLKTFLADAWAEAQRENPALGPCSMTVVGEGVLQAKIAHYLVPTLTESFGITAAVIFLAFLVVFGRRPRAHGDDPFASPFWSCSSSCA
jgi:hypothetical protein